MDATGVSRLFPITSRYYGTGTSVLVEGDRQIPYLQRRFLPSAGQFMVLRMHNVVEGDRLDNIAAANLGDPLAFWRICDSNNAMRPEDLTATPGAAIRITLPQGIPGATNG